MPPDYASLNDLSNALCQLPDNLSTDGEAWRLNASPSKNGSYETEDASL
ncbi:MAG: hypothetical protein IPL53_15455 [Ignavibacteria bacterium]|nr:hypothetical protein [Ignavibacteria bacterium]